MKQLRRVDGSARRAGVTLTELMVAIAIIAVLAGLTFAFLAVGQRAAERFEAQASASGVMSAKSTPPRIPPAGSQKVPNRYIVTFKPSVTDPHAEAARLAKTVPAHILSVYTHALHGCAVRI